MNALAQSLDEIIDEQLADGSVNCETEAERLIVSEVSRRTLERKLKRAQQQIDNGEYHESGDDFINGVLSQARNEVSAKYK